MKDQKKYIVALSLILAIVSTACTRYNRQNRNRFSQIRPHITENEAAAFLVHGQMTNNINISPGGGVGTGANGIGDRTENPTLRRGAPVGDRSGGSSPCYVGLASVNTSEQAYSYGGYQTNGFDTGYRFPVYCDPQSQISVSRTNMYVTSSDRKMFAVPYDYFSYNAAAGVALQFDVGVPTEKIATSITGYAAMISTDGHTLIITRERGGRIPTVLRKLYNPNIVFTDVSWDDIKDDDEPQLYLAGRRSNGTGSKLFIIPISALNEPNQIRILSNFGTSNYGAYNPRSNNLLMPLNPFSRNTPNGILELGLPSTPIALASNQGLTTALLQGLGPMAFDFQNSLSENSAGSPVLAVSKYYEMTNRTEPGQNALNKNYIDVAVGVAGDHGQIFLLGSNSITSYIYYDSTTSEGMLENAWTTTAPDETVFSGVEFTSIQVGATRFLTLTTRNQGLFTIPTDDWGNLITNINFDQPDVPIANIISASPIPSEAQMPASIYGDNGNKQMSSAQDPYANMQPEETAAATE
ncbi:MAG: hypothetical protein R3A11_04100 [Bdellovibrionota bacterium]